jgi:hypothetical protein
MIPGVQKEDTTSLSLIQGMAFPVSVIDHRYMRSQMLSANPGKIVIRSHSGLWACGVLILPVGFGYLYQPHCAESPGSPSLPAETCHPDHSSRLQVMLPDELPEVFQGDIQKIRSEDERPVLTVHLDKGGTTPAFTRQPGPPGIRPAR